MIFGKLLENLWNIFGDLLSFKGIQFMVDAKSLLEFRILIIKKLWTGVKMVTNFLGKMFLG